MRVIVFGGSGNMGRHTTRALLGMPFVEHVTVAGLDTPQAQRFVAACGPRCGFEAVEASDGQSLAAAFSSHDVVVNLAGPYFRYGETVFSAALSARKPYIDIADDVAPTLAFLERDAEAKAAGVPAVCGLGASPGITNLLAKAAAARLEHVQEIDTAWDLLATSTVDDGFTADVASGVPSAALVHWMHCCSGPVDVVRDGRRQQVRAVEEYRLEIGHGDVCAAWSVGHPEPITLPVSYPGLRSCRNFMTGGRDTFAAVAGLRDRIEAGALTFDEAALTFEHSWLNIPPQTVDDEIRSRRSHKGFYLVAVARGECGGRATQVTARLDHPPSGGMGAITGIPAAIGVELLHDGLLGCCGTFAPEAAIEPADFFDRLARYCPAGTSPDCPMIRFDTHSRRGLEISAANFAR